jgi:hypothetical protein
MSYKCGNTQFNLTLIFSELGELVAGIDNNLETEGPRDQEKIASAIVRDFTLVSLVSRSHGLKKKDHTTPSVIQKKSHPN